MRLTAHTGEDAVFIRGETGKVKCKIKEYGGQWDRSIKAWVVRGGRGSACVAALRTMGAEVEEFGDAPAKAASTSSESDASGKRAAKRAARDAARAEAFHAKRRAQQAAAAPAPVAAAPAAAPALAPAVAAAPQAAVGGEGGGKKAKRSARDKARAEAFHAKKKAQEAGAAPAAAPEAPAAEAPAAAEPAAKKKKMSERDQRRAEAFAAKQKLKHAPKNAKGQPIKPLWETHCWKRVFVANLGYDTTDAQAQQFLANGTRQHGEIERTSWLTDQEKKFKGCGFVQFSTWQAAKAAVDMSGSQLNGRKVKVAWQQDKPKESKGPGQSGALTEKPDGCVTVHLGNLAFETTEAEIEAWAGENCGAVDVVRVLRNKKTQKSTGCGFVAFKQAVADEAVDKAIALGKASASFRSSLTVPVRSAFASAVTKAQALDHRSARGGVAGRADAARAIRCEGPQAAAQKPHAGRAKRPGRSDGRRRRLVGASEYGAEWRRAGG